MATKSTANELEKSVEDKLIGLGRLQEVYSEIDRIRTLRGELPLEVQDLEDEIAGMHTRLEHLEEDSKKLAQTIATQKAKIANAQTLIDKYKGQLDGVKNNREYDNLSKEIEFQGLEVELAEKKIAEYNEEAKLRKENIQGIKEQIENRQADLALKREELERIKKETRQEEEALRLQAIQIEESTEERLLKAFHRIREGARNGLAVVSMDRDACGGCFNKIPPQKQLDIRLHKKIIVCEYCGRIMIDAELKEATQQ